MSVKKVLSSLVSLALSAGVLFSAPVFAATPETVAVEATGEVGLTGIWMMDDPLLGGEYRSQSATALTPAFKPSFYEYHIATHRNQMAIAATFAEGLTAKISYTLDGVPTSYDLESDVRQSLPIDDGETVMTIEVTDGETTTSYLIHVYSKMLPLPQITSFTPTVLSQAGGDLLTIRMKNFLLPNNYDSNGNWLYNGNYCYLNGNIDGQYVYIDSWGAKQDPSTGETIFGASVPNFFYSDDSSLGSRDLRLRLECSLQDGRYGMWYSSEKVFPDALTVVAPEVSSVTVADSLTLLDHFDVQGTAISNRSELCVYLELEDIQYFDDESEETGNSRLYFSSARYEGAGKATYFLSPYHGYRGNRQTIYENSSDARLVIATGNDCNLILYSKDGMTWDPPTPQDITFSPSSAPLAGGQPGRFRITGKFLALGDDDEFTVTINGQPVTDLELVQSPWDEWDSYLDFANPDVITGTIPPSLEAGKFDVVVTNERGLSAKAVQRFTYAKQPVIASVTPSTVATSGGSVITLVGTDFGTSGTPVVTVGGVKATCVTRINSTKVTAVVPAGVAGNAEVVLVSPQNGGPSVAASMTYVEPTTAPTLSSVSPSQISINGGDEVVIQGSNFGAKGTVGVTIGGRCARVVGQTDTQLTVLSPFGDPDTTVDVVVSSVSGSATKSVAVYYVPNSGIRKITPSTVQASAREKSFVLNGFGFGATGTVMIGAAGPFPYTSSNGGKTITLTDVKLQGFGPQVVRVAPTGNDTSFTSRVTIKAPMATYMGTPEYNSNFEFPTQKSSGSAGLIFTLETATGGRVRIAGEGFGTEGGTVTVGSTIFDIPVGDNWSDTEILVDVPATPTGTYAVSVEPEFSTGVLELPMPLAVTRNSKGLVITKMDLENPAHANTKFFSPREDVSDIVVVEGFGFLGSDNGATSKITVQSTADNYSYGQFAPAAEIVSITDTKITFKLPRDLDENNWANVTVHTDISQASINNAFYIRTPVGPVPQYWISRNSDVCMTADQISEFNIAAIGQSTTVITLTASMNGFGDSGTVAIRDDNESKTIVPNAWSSSELVLDFATLASGFSDPWSAKTIVVTPTGKPAIYLSIDCRIIPTVETEIVGGTNANGLNSLTIAAGTDYSVNVGGINTSNKWLPGDTFIPRAISDEGTNYGFEWISKAERERVGYFYAEGYGFPRRAGEYYIRVNRFDGTYDTTKYQTPLEGDIVYLNLTGTKITITPVLAGTLTSPLEYDGGLTDGTAGTETEVTYVVTDEFGEPFTPTHPITKVNWGYRFKTCAQYNYGFNDGLPRDASVDYYGCGTYMAQTDWQIRVNSFEMMVGGVDQSIKYLPTFETLEVAVTPKVLTMSNFKAHKKFDEGPYITNVSATLTGVIPGDDAVINDDSFWDRARFDSSDPGTTAYTFTRDIRVSGNNWVNYVLSDPRPTGLDVKIEKSQFMIQSTPSVRAVTSEMLDSGTTFEISNEYREVGEDWNTSPNGFFPETLARTLTPSVCSVEGMTVTPLAGGECRIAVWAEENSYYLDSLSMSDPTSIDEIVSVNVFTAPQKLSVFIDDVTIGEGETIEPSFTVYGLIPGDEVDSVEFTYFKDGNPVEGVPSEAGVYAISGATVNFASGSMSAYDAEVQYVRGVLTIVSAPPSISSLTPNHGPEAGGNTVTFKGENLGSITRIEFGETVYKLADFTVSADGTELSLVVPAGFGSAEFTLYGGATVLTEAYAYDEPEVLATTITSISPMTGAPAGGDEVVISGIRLNRVTKVLFGDLELELGVDYVINDSGSAITLLTPAGTGTVTITLVTDTNSPTVNFTFVSDDPLGPRTSAAGLAAGSSKIFINGKPSQFKFVPRTNALGVTTNTSNWGMIIQAKDKNKKSKVVNDKDVLVFERGLQGAVSGSGFKPNSNGKIYIYSTPKLLTTFKTNAKGSFVARFKVPTDIAVGLHTIQINAYAPNGSVRSSSLGVKVIDQPVETFRAISWSHGKTFPIPVGETMSIKWTQSIKNSPVVRYEVWAGREAKNFVRVYNTKANIQSGSFKKLSDKSWTQFRVIAIHQDGTRSSANVFGLQGTFKKTGVTNSSGLGS